MDKPKTIVVRNWQEAFQQSDVNATTQHVCYTIQSFVGFDGKGCWPSFETIAKRAKIHRRTVIEHVNRAVKAGLLKVERRKSAAGVPTSNVYSLTFPANMILPRSEHVASDGASGPPSPRVDGGAGSLGVVAQDHPKYINTKLDKKGERVASNTQEQPEKAKADETTFDGATITLDSKNRAFWLERFDGDADRLDMALIAAAAYVQPNGNRSLIVQVNAQLARTAGDKRDKDKRYAASVKSQPARSRAAAATTGAQTPFQLELARRLAAEGHTP